MSKTILCDVESLYKYLSKQVPDDSSNVIAITPPFEIRKTVEFHSECGNVYYYDIINRLTNELLICDGEVQEFKLLDDGCHQ